MRAIALAALVALPLLAPSASACSRVSDDGFWTTLAWPANGTLLTNYADRLGAYTLSNATFVPTLVAEAVATSPDLRWWAYEVGTGERPPGGDVVSMDTCGTTFYGETGVLDTRDGTRHVMLGGGATALAASERYLAVAHREREGVSLYEWGRWDAPARSFPIRTEDVGYAPSGERFLNGDIHLLAFDPSGRFLLVAGPPRFVVLVDLAATPPTLRPIQVYADTPVEAVAFSPDGQRIAFVTNARWDAFGEVHIMDTRSDDLPAGRAGVAAITAVAWGPAGLAVIEREILPYHGTRISTLVLHRDGNLSDRVERRLDDGSAALAWSPDGARLAVGHNGRLRLFDAALAPVADLRVENVAETTPLVPPHDDGEPLAKRAIPTASALVAMVAALIVALGRRP